MTDVLWDKYLQINSELDASQELFPSMEYFNPKQFILNYQIIRNSHLANGRIITLNEKIQLPINSVLHLFDAITTPNDIRDIPDLESNVLLNNETSRKVWYNVLGMQEGTLPYEETFRFIPTNLPANLLKFRKDHGKDFFFAQNIKSFPTAPNSLPIINHNPIWRTRIRGGVTALQYHRKLMLAYTSIINTIIEVAELHPARVQYLILPWGEEVYGREVFQRTQKAIDVSSLRFPKSYQYLMMAHLVNYLNNPALSIFAKLPEEVMSKVVLIIGDPTEKCIFVSPSALKSFTPASLTAYRFINNLNQLSLTLRDSEEAKRKLEELTTEEPDEETVIRGSEVPTDLVTDRFTSTTIKSERIAEVDGLTKEDKVENIIAKSAKEIPISKQAVEANDSTIIDSDAVTAEATEEVKYTSNSAARRAVDSPKRKVQIREARSQTGVEKFATVDTATASFSEECDQKAMEFLDSKVGELSPKRIAYLKDKALAYKRIEVNGQTIESILNTPTDITIPENVLGDNVVGENPLDPSVRNCTIRSLDRAYMDKMFTKHLVGIVSSFRAQGIFLTDIKTERVANVVNDDTFYSCRFMDYRGKTSVVRFKLPNINRQGRFKVDGVESILLKQRINTPIVKISDTEVSLSSNYNKARVIRNTAVAHSFYSYIDNFLNSKKSSASVTYGNAVVNAPISYEYSCLCERYESVSFRTLSDKVRCELYFNYPKRLEHFGGKEAQLKKLEDAYGVYLGTWDGKWLFVDRNNFVTATETSGSVIPDFPYTSITDICRQSATAPDGLKKQLTEWVTFRNLDINLPVIFVLAYRFGLRYILDDLGVEYTITENRSKVIIGGSGITSGTESATEHFEEPDYSRGVDRILRTLRHYRASDTEMATLADELLHCTHFREVLAAPGLQPRSIMLAELADYIRTDKLPDDFEYQDKLVELGKYLAHEVNDNMSKYNCIFQVYPDRYELNRLDSHPVTPTSEPDIIRTDHKHVPLAGTEALGGGVRYTPKSGDMPIKFADRVLWVNRYPLEHSLIVAGLDAFDLTQYQLAEFESKEVYYRILMDMNKSINYLKGIDSFFDLFIDPITYGVLKEMNEPTEVKGLLYRSAQLLSTRDHRPAASSVNYRIRGYEQINAIIYNEMSRAVHKWQANKTSANVFNINPEAVYLKLVTNAAVLTTDTSNPLQDIKFTSSMTFAGTGGRSAESFVLEDRRYVADDIGIMAMDTSDNQKVGMNAQLTINTQIANTSGTLRVTDGKGLSPSDVLSVHSLVFPFATNDDFKRLNFIGIQSSHMIPTAAVERSRVRTGYERVIAQYCGRRFAGVAEQDGKVTNIDNDAKTVEVRYADGRVDIFGFGEVYNEHESVSSTGELVCNVKVGDKVRKGDVVVYDKTFFTKDKTSGQVDFSIGVLANTVLMETDTTLEDAACISQRLAEKLAIQPVNTRVVKVPRNSVIYSSVKVGDTVAHTDKLMVFEENVSLEEGEEDPLLAFKGDAETLELLGDLNKRTPTAKFAGKIVRIDAIHDCPLASMHPSLQRIVKSAAAPVARRAAIAEGTMAEQDFPPPGAIPTGSKVKGVDFDGETVALIFYIQESQVTQVGDKCVLALQLKHTVSSVMQRPQYTGDGEEIDVVFSADAIGRRIVLSATYLGILNRILETMEKTCVTKYFS